ncbi:hypothetical protein DPD62_25365, partial [Salmonella enterica subsp. enterica serovar Apapa]|nr:hypothetical protein [Salmonella enterica subsp. enterica serovar Apapa]
ERIMKKMKVWCYLNIDNPFVAWEVAIGRITSLEVLPCMQEQDRRCFLTQWQYSRIKNAFCGEPLNTIPLKNEFRIEHIRTHYFPRKVSRLRGSFFFKSKNDAINIVNYYKWGGFNPNHLSEVDLYYANDSDISFYDSTWFTQKASEVMCDEDINNYLNNVTYWGNDVEPATEILAYGFGFVLNESLIKKAYDIVKEKYPDAMCYADTARLMIRASKKLAEKFSPNWELYEAGITYGLNQVGRIVGENDISYVMRDKSFKKYGLLQSGYPEKIRTPNFSELFFSYSSDGL